MRPAVLAATTLAFGTAALVAASCGGNKTPTTPTPPPVTVTTVTLSTSTDMLKVGERVTFAATALHSDGSNATVTDWSSDTPSVATVDAASGLVTGVSAGQATIIARHDGVTGTKLVRVVPDYQGTWSGTYRVTNCTDSGDFATFGWCSITLGLRGSITISLSQFRDSVTGTLALNEVTGPVSGPIAINGAITLSGIAVSGDASATLSNWNTNAASPGSMTGSFQFRITSTGLSGSALHYCDIVSVTKGLGATYLAPKTLIGETAGPVTPDRLLRALGFR